MAAVQGSDSPKEFTFLQSLSVYSSSARGAAKEVKTVFYKLLPTLKLWNGFFQNWYYCPPFLSVWGRTCRLQWRLSKSVKCVGVKRMGRKLCVRILKAPAGFACWRGEQPVPQQCERSAWAAAGAANNCTDKTGNLRIDTDKNSLSNSFRTFGILQLCLTPPEVFVKLKQEESMHATGMILFNGFSLCLCERGSIEERHLKYWMAYKITKNASTEQVGGHQQKYYPGGSVRSSIPFWNQREVLA